MLNTYRKEEPHMDAFLVFTVILLWGIPVSIIIENSNSKAKYITVVTVLSLALSHGLFGLKNTMFITIWVICVILIAILLFRIISELFER